MATGNGERNGPGTETVVMATGDGEVTFYQIDGHSGCETPVKILRHEAAEPYLAALTEAGRLTLPVRPMA